MAASQVFDTYGNSVVAANLGIFNVAIASGVKMVPNPLDSSRLDLVVGGTSSNDVIQVLPAAGGKILVILNSSSYIFSKPTGRVVAYGRGGDDVIQISAALALTSFLYGGTGDDVLIGGAGNDVLVGGDGSDTLQSGAGRNILLSGTAGAGIQTLNGALGENVLVAGVSIHDANDLAMLSLLAEWSRLDADYATRTNHLRGTLAGGLNGSYLLNTSTVADNAAAEIIIAGGNYNWYFARTAGSKADTIIGKKSNEWIEAI